MSRMVRNQVIAFILVTTLGLGYAMTSFVGLPRLLGIGQYRVWVEMPDTGGLYASADVTERGVTIGRVTSIGVHGHGIRAGVSLNDGTRIPASGLRAAVRNTSAVGEQYLQLTPAAAGPPYLGPGSVVPASAVSLPPSSTRLLNNLNALLRSVPRKQLDITINELYNAFNGSGPQLRQLLASSGQLLAAAQRNVAPTTGLLRGLRPVLGTQAAHSADLTSLSRNLASLSAQLRASNPDLSGTLSQLPGFLSELNGLVGQVQPTVPLLLANLTSSGRVLEVYLPGVRQVLVILPAVLNDIDADIQDSGVPGSALVDFAAEVNNPPACQQGYTTPVRDPSETNTIPAPARAQYCRAAADSPEDIRGARNDPCPGNPALRSATAAGCGLFFGDTASEDTSSGDTGSGDTGRGAGTGGTGGDGVGTYDPTTGLLYGPDGNLYSVGTDSVTGDGPTTLAGLLRQTLGS